MDNTTGQKIAALRRGQNLSQEQLAEALNVTRQTISNWENDRVKIDVISGAQICAFFGISMDELFGSGSPPAPARRAGAGGLPAVLLFVIAAILLVLGGIVFAIGWGNATSLVLTTRGGATCLIIAGAIAAILGAILLFKRK